MPYELLSKPYLAIVETHQAYDRLALLGHYHLSGSWPRRGHQSKVWIRRVMHVTNHFALSVSCVYWDMIQGLNLILPYRGFNLYCKAAQYLMFNKKCVCVLTCA